MRIIDRDVGLSYLSLASLPHTETNFIAGVLAYNGIAGIIYAAFSGLSLGLAGIGNPTAATQVGLFAAATNGAIAAAAMQRVSQGNRLGVCQLDERRPNRRAYPPGGFASRCRINGTNPVKAGWNIANKIDGAEDPSWCHVIA